MKNLSQNLEPDFILFGGAFDPPHNGHRDCLNIVKQRFPNAVINIVPSLVSPINTSENKHSSASFEDRMEMCRIAFSGLNILDVERHLPSPSYTIQTLQYIHKKFPGKHLGFVIGLDQMNKFHSWFKPHKILELASLILIPRDKIDIESTLHDFTRNLGISIARLQNNRIEFGNYLPAFFIPNQTRSVSSHEIRHLLKDGEDISNSVVDKKVLAYIQSKKLYASQD